MVEPGKEGGGGAGLWDKGQGIHGTGLALLGEAAAGRGLVRGMGCIRGAVRWPASGHGRQSEIPLPSGPLPACMHMSRGTRAAYLSPFWYRLPVSLLLKLPLLCACSRPNFCGWAGLRAGGERAGEGERRVLHGARQEELWGHPPGGALERLLALVPVCLPVRAEALGRAEHVAMVVTWAEGKTEVQRWGNNRVVRADVRAARTLCKRSMR